MAPERIFQGRQRGILGLFGSKDTCNTTLTRSPPRALRLELEAAPPALFRAPLPNPRPKHEPRPLAAAPSRAPGGTHAPTPRPPQPGHARSGAPRAEWPLPVFAAAWQGCTDAQPARLRLPSEKGCAGARASARLWPPRALPERRAAFLTAAARGCSAWSDPTTQPGSVQLGGGGVYSAVAPTLWPLGPQRAAPGSARAGGGCYARNVRVSGSPSGSKRTTNNLSARLPPPPSASSRCLLPAPAFLWGGGAAGQSRGRPPSSVPRPPRALQDALHPSPPCSPPTLLLPRFAFRAAGEELIQLSPLSSLVPSPPSFHPFMCWARRHRHCLSPRDSGVAAGEGAGGSGCACVRACV